MRILIVEDEMVSRTKMHTIMRSFGDCILAENGHQAIEMFEKECAGGVAFDLVTLDINMPDMQGTEVLQKLRTIENNHGVLPDKNCFIMMVTSELDKEQVLNCIHNGCDDYIVKPFNIDVIRKKLSKRSLARKLEVDDKKGNDTPKAFKADAIFKDINKALKSGEIDLPSLPRISDQFRKLVQNNADMEELAELLKKDMAIASKLIRISNSVLYRGFGTVGNIQQAVSRLGLSTTEQLVSAFANQQLYAVNTSKYRKLLASLWDHALACAFAADIIANSLSLKLPIDAFTGGLFHDVGALALIQITAEMENRKRFPMAIEPDAVLETVRAYHAMFGAKLLQKWNFEFDYVRITLYHNSLHSAESVTDELLVVHLANQVAKSLNYTIFEPIDNLSLVETPSAQQLKLDNDQLVVLQQNVLEHMQQATDPAA